MTETSEDKGDSGELTKEEMFSSTTIQQTPDSHNYVDFVKLVPDRISYTTVP